MTDVPGEKRLAVRDDLAYMLPMLVFLAFVWAGGNWKELYPHFYVARAIVVPVFRIANSGPFVAVPGMTYPGGKKLNTVGDMNGT